MEISERLEQLVNFLAIEGNIVEGKKKMQKLVYLAQRLGFPFDYDYTYHNFGVYSGELESDLQIAEHIGLIQRKPTGKFEEVAIELLRVPETPFADEETKTEILRNLGREEPRTLEVLSTVVYLRDKGYSGNTLRSELERLKGHLPPANQERAWELFQSLLEQG